MSLKSHNKKNVIFNFYDFLEAKLKIMSIIGIAGFPIYYFVWHNWFPQSYENFPLRITCSLVSIPWLLGHLVTEKYKKVYIAYIFFSILFCLPYFFSFMWLKNDFSVIWAMSYIAQIFLLTIMVYDWFIIAVMLLMGFGASYLSVFFLDGEVSFTHFNFEYIPVILFAIFPGIIFHRHVANHTEKEGILTAFGASIAHEMRNSIAISIGASRIALRILDENVEKSQNKNEIAIQANDLEEIQQTMHLLQNSSFRTSMVIDIILKNIHNQQIETDKFINLSIFDIISTAVNEFGYKEGEKEKIKIDRIENFTFHGDKDLMVFILFNLFSNAFTYNTLNKSEIHIWTETHEKNNTLHVRDNGPGVPKEKLTVIFDRFISIGNKGGTGLGLTFCKRVMLNFKGDITCESEEGKYTEFIIKFPVINEPFLQQASVEEWVDQEENISRQINELINSDAKVSDKITNNLNSINTI